MSSKHKFGARLPAGVPAHVVRRDAAMQPTLTAS
ncbi:hypothetical protein DFR52_1011038 [Hoeflea marina]|uniref:Uncharacterized protein n=1 Tax=Hoeflea marina TaxID=274592 RepID=A0A317PSA2_9HYPH|nr:hypothetical protein DFR52_1011038 [Hoeflea marina]